MTTAGAPMAEHWEQAARMVSGSVKSAKGMLRAGASTDVVRHADFAATMQVFADVPVEDRDEFVRYLAACVACAVTVLAIDGTGSAS